MLGEGPLQASIMFVGEAPGMYEDRQGRPFVGAAGKALTELIESAGLSREEVYITNVVKCRPPGNRDPTEEEIHLCSIYLKKQLELIRPKLVVALGRISASALLGRPVIMSKEHGSLVDCSYAGLNFKLFLTYHPAAGIYSGRTKLELQTDFKKLGDIIAKLNLG